MHTLEQLCHLLGSQSDKTTIHSYGEIYDQLFVPYRGKFSRILEIGSGNQDSVQLWHAYFSGSQVDMLDWWAHAQLQDYAKCNLGVTLHTGANPYDLRATRALEPYDIIIDDGNHALQSQQFVITHMLAKVKPGGLLVIEDIQDVLHLQALRDAVPKYLQAHCQVYDVRHVKDRYDDILFVIHVPPAPPIPARPRTLLFCTSYADSMMTWNNRYAAWAHYYSHCQLHWDQMLIVDDASTVLPQWPEWQIAQSPLMSASCDKVIYTWPQRLGQDNHVQGWYRSFHTALQWAMQQGFDKIIHIESDAAVISERARHWINTCNQGWHTLWCASHDFPELTISVINRDSMDLCHAWFDVPWHHRDTDWVVEDQISIPHINKKLVGDRYSEFQDHVPTQADFACQIANWQDPQYCWWLPLSH